MIDLSESLILRAPEVQCCACCLYAPVHQVPPWLIVLSMVHQTYRINETLKLHIPAPPDLVLPHSSRYSELPFPTQATLITSEEQRLFMSTSKGMNVSAGICTGYVYIRNKVQ